jgi:hypothetical protein
MEAPPQKNIKQNIFLFIIGFIGVLSSLPLIPKLLALQPETPPLPIYVLQLLSVVQSSALLFGMVLLGSFFAPQVKLTAPTILAIAKSETALDKIKSQIYPAIIGGVLGGLFLLVFFDFFSNYLPPEFLASAAKFSPPWYTRVLYGGITEEILVRWGLMSFFVWCSYRVTQAKNSEIRSYNYILAISLSALVFGIGHLPVAFSLSPVVTIPLLTYIIMGNAAFGFIAGYLFWKHGLECAIGSHIIAHLTMLIAEVIVS